MIESAELAPLAEIVRIPSPAVAPQALAHTGETLWVGSWQTGRMYGIDPKQGRVFEDAAAPGRPVGATPIGEELRVVVSENGDDDNRFIRRFVPGHGFKSHEATPCPDDTGSFLAYDGARLWLTQRHNKRVLELDANYAPVRTIDIGVQILGAAFVDDRLYLSTWKKDAGGCRIAYIEPASPEPVVRFVARAPFVAIALARDGDRLWTNDPQGNEIVAFALPA